MAILDATGPKLIFQNTAATTSSAGSWYECHPKISAYSFQVIFTGSSAVSTGAVTLQIEASNNGSIALPDPVRLFSAMSLTTNTVTTGGCCTGSSMIGPWGFLRANITSLTTSTAGSAGFPQVSVYCNAR